MAKTVLQEIPFKRFALPADPAWIRALVPASLSGAYILLRDKAPCYVGRSDRCLQSRLCSHEKLFEASHVLWEPCQDELHAFFLESFWYDHMKHLPTLRNKIHPAHPDGEDVSCPFCSIDKRATQAILPAWPRHADAA